MTPAHRFVHGDRTDLPERNGTEKPRLRETVSIRRRFNRQRKAGTTADSRAPETPSSGRGIQCVLRRKTDPPRREGEGEVTEGHTQSRTSRLDVGLFQRPDVVEAGGSRRYVLSRQMLALGVGEMALGERIETATRPVALDINPDRVRVLLNCNHGIRARVRKIEGRRAHGLALSVQQDRLPERTLAEPKRPGCTPGQLRKSGPQQRVTHQKDVTILVETKAPEASSLGIVEQIVIHPEQRGISDRGNVAQP